MFGLTKLRLFEIGVALLLTLGALVFVGLTVWAAEIASLEVADAWARPTIGQGRTAAAYMTIANKGATGDVLKSARTAKAKAVEMHQTTMTADGIMQMRKVEGGLPIEAGASLVFEPGGSHLMLVGLEDALKAGEELMLTLEFAHAGTVDVRVPVAASGPPVASSSR
ncbi:MAG: copper chaperone PCu(A)C [Methyloceanibacter sp.]|jgi:periplasmic copper chaperone A|nr:copper chaperone PCu(A)C [Methyloceanibacter sp.]